MSILLVSMEKRGTHRQVLDSGALLDNLRETLFLVVDKMVSPKTLQDSQGHSMYQMAINIQQSLNVASDPSAAPDWVAKSQGADLKLYHVFIKLVDNRCG